MCAARIACFKSGNQCFIFWIQRFFHHSFFCSKNDTSFASEFDPTVCDKTKSRFFDEKTPDDPPHPQYNVDRRFAWEAESPEEIAFFHTNIVLGVRGIIHFFVFMKKYDCTKKQRVRKGVFSDPFFLCSYNNFSIILYHARLREKKFGCFIFRVGNRIVDKHRVGFWGIVLRWFRLFCNHFELSHTVGKDN